MKLKTKIRVVVWAFIGCIALFASAAFVYVHLGNWLVVSDPLPQKMDIIFTFSGDSRRLSYSKNLFEKYPNAQWLISDDHNQNRTAFLKQGLSETRIYNVNGCTNTFAEVKALNGWLSQKYSPENRQIKIGLVSCPYHMRRIQMMITKRFFATDYKFYYLAVPLDQYDEMKPYLLKEWWKSVWGKYYVIGEVKKMLYFLFAGGTNA